MIGRGSTTSGFWRPLTGIAVAYAVAVQSLLVALGGFALPAHADQTAAAFELCLHDGDAPALPADKPGKSGCTHCIFCFAGAHHALVAPAPPLLDRLDAAIIGTPRAADKRSLTALPAHSIASPRGPPSGA